MKEIKHNVQDKKPWYIKPIIVVSYTKDELKKQFKELQGQSGYYDIDLSGLYESPDKKIYDSLNQRKFYKV